MNIWISLKLPVIALGFWLCYEDVKLLEALVANVTQRQSDHTYGLLGLVTVCTCYSSIIITVSPSLSPRDI
jgi:hypothetical protein